jgi:hypothetical protein
MANWTYLAADLATGSIMNELPLTGVNFSRLLNDAGTFTASLPLGDPRVAKLDPVRCTEPARTTILVKRDNVLVGDFIIWTAAYDSGDQSDGGTPPTISIGGADPLSYFDHRKILPLLPPEIDTSTVARQTLAYSNVDRNAIARGLVATAQSHTGGGYLNVQLDASSSGVLDTLTYNGFQMTNVGQALRDIAALADGPDFYFDIAYVAGTPTRFLRLGTPRLGNTDMTGSTVFIAELGANMSQFTWPRDGSQMASRFFAVGDGMDADQPIALAEDASLYSAGWPLLEANGTDSGTLTPAQLTAYATAQQAALDLPLVLPTLTVVAAPPALGDNIRMIVARGEDPYFPDGADMPLRHISYSTTPADDTLESTVLTCAQILEGT